MEIARRESKDVAILDFSGPLTAGGGDEKLRSAINECVAEECEKILINLAEVSRIDSTGIGELVASIKLARRFGSTVKLVSINSRVRHILDLSRILPLLDFYDTEDEALRNFAGSSQAT